MDSHKRLSESSPFDGPTKRASTGGTEDSPAAKRAKRLKHGKKRRSKEAKDLDGYTEEKDRVMFDRSPATGSPISQKQTPVELATSFPLKQAHKTHLLKSAEKLPREHKTDVKKEGTKAEEDLGQGGKYSRVQQNPKTEANTRKTRTDADLKGDLKHAGKTDGLTIGADVKPSKAEKTQRKLFAEPSSGFESEPQVTFNFSSPPTSSKTSDKAHHSSDNEMKAPTAPAGTKTLKAINKHLKSLETKLDSAHCPDAITKEMQALRGDIAKLHERLERDNLRAAIRHEMLFNALIKVSTDVGRLRQEIREKQQQQGQHDAEGQNEGVGEGAHGGAGEASTSAAAVKGKHSRKRKSESMKQSGKTLEQCLKSFAEDMNRAASADEVKKYGRLCVQYAGDLFKTLG